MQNARLDYVALNGAIAYYKLPGGIEMSDFQRYYLTEAAKAYMGLQSDFGFSQDGSTKSKTRVLEEVIPILKSFCLLVDSDPAYNLFQKFTKVRAKIGDESLFEDTNFKLAMEKIEEADHLLNATLEKHENRNKTLGIDAQEEINKIIRESGLTKEEVFNQLK
jgi:hypothetical protein